MTRKPVNTQDTALAWIEPDYSGEPSYDVLDALRLVLLFHSGGEWNAAKRAEWLRITGTDEATTKVMCDHIRSALAMSKA